MSFRVTENFYSSPVILFGNDSDVYSLNESYNHVVAKSRLEFPTCLLDHYATKAVAYEDDGSGLFLWRLSTLDLFAAQIGMKSHLGG